MLSTIIADEYSYSDREDIAAALDVLCSPKDTYGWASAGVYSFSDPIDHRILYIGLASDLWLRFRQHNGLVAHAARGNKFLYVKERLQEHENLRFAFIAQSAMSQPLTPRALEEYGAAGEDVVGLCGDLQDEGLHVIRDTEGAWLQAHLEAFGCLPPWNRIGGSVKARSLVRPEIRYVLELLSGARDSFFIARRTLREIAANETVASYEMWLHGARMTFFQGDFIEHLYRVPDDFGLFRERILSSGYLFTSTAEQAAP